VTSQLAYTPLPEELELARLLVALEERRGCLGKRDAERAELEMALTQFAAQVKSRVGDMKDEIRAHRAKLEEIRQRVQRLKADPDATPADVERSIAEELEGEEEPEPVTGFRGRADGPPSGSMPATPAASPQTVAEVLRLYRVLAKRHHPDLATTPAERERRTELMLRVNIAYRDHNLQVLQALMLEVHMDLPLVPSELCKQRISWARHEMKRLEREMRVVDHRIDSLLASDTYALWMSELEGQPALDDLEQRTRERLQRERSRLDEASSQYARMAARRQVMLRRAASRMSVAMPSASPGSD
jgi:archaellum component FlaC